MDNEGVAKVGKNDKEEKKNTYAIKDNFYEQNNYSKPLATQGNIGKVSSKIVEPIPKVEKREESPKSGKHGDRCNIF